MAERFYSERPIQGPKAELAGPELHHLTRVMRAKAGDEVLLIDGSGAEFDARITSVGRCLAELAVLARREVDRELPGTLTVAVALPKGDRQKWLVEKCVELGVTRLLPLATRRGVAQPKEAALERLRRGVIEATKQCGRTRLMEIAEPAAWSDYAASATAQCRLVAHPHADMALGDVAWPGVSRGKQPEVIVAIGPEGGFADEELGAALAAGWQAIHLGSRILRIETAAMLVAAWAATQWTSPRS